MTGIVATIGEVLVEMMVVEKGRGFGEHLHWEGPFASGAPAIFIDQVAKLGHPSAIVSAVGEDDFGRLNLDRLRGDGVDTDGIEVLADQVTATAFVRYRWDGERGVSYRRYRSA
jgi:sugar/nucleoside kinase (ribokinase family)